MQKSLDEFTAAGVRPVAISVDTPQQSAGMIKRHGLTFPILSDPNLEAIRAYHLLHAGGGPGNANISRPAEFLVDDTGTVRWTNFAEDIRVRARADEMLAAARKIR
jgi:peroxiredoxin